MLADKAPLNRTTSRRLGAFFVAALLALTALAGCNTGASAARPGTIAVVAAENEYGNVASQVGGKYVTVFSIESNPNTDPHDYEVSPGVAAEVSAAQVVIQNGLSYDTYMGKIESASPSKARKVIDVQQLLGLPGDTPNPHLWYDPRTMPKVADALAADLGKLQPGHAAYFRANASEFVDSLEPWLQAIQAFRAAHPGTPVATTEPVADYMLEAAGTDNLSPFGLQADIMNGVDPSPQDVALQMNLLKDRRVKVFVYNQQVTDSLTASFITAARQAGIPVIGVYETMPTPGYSYQSWMLAEVRALERAVVDGASTVRL